MIQGYITPAITLLYHYDDQPMPKEFESYPSRTITVSDEVWDKLKTAKLKSGKTWTNFIKGLLKPG